MAGELDLKKEVHRIQFDENKLYRPGTPEWDIKAGITALRFVAPMLPCAGCRQPFIKGWQCSWCGDKYPEEEAEKRAEKVMKVITGDEDG